jgi:ZIP family zinc transporter
VVRQEMATVTSHRILGKVNTMPVWLQALFWGTLAGAALVLGSAVSWWWTIPPKVVSLIMSFGAGVLISALAFDLVDEAVRAGGLWPTAAGFLAGAVVYVAANAFLAQRGAKHRKRSGGKQPSEKDNPGSGTAIAVGALLDGIPESIVLGLGLVAGGTVSPAILAAVFISNVPEGLSSTAGMKKAGRRAGYVFGVWGGIAVISGIASLIGYASLQSASVEVVAFITATAAGAILAMLADTMIPEAFEEHHVLTGLIAAVGFLTAFTISQVGM